MYYYMILMNIKHVVLSSAETDKGVERGKGCPLRL